MTWPKMVTLGSKVRELKPNPYVTCEFIHKPQGVKNNYAQPSKGMEDLRVTKLGTRWHHDTLMTWPKMVTLRLKVRELQPNPFGKCEFRHMPQVVKTNNARPCKGMEGPRLSKLGTHWNHNTLTFWPKLGDSMIKVKELQPNAFDKWEFRQASSGKSQFCKA